MNFNIRVPREALIALALATAQILHGMSLAVAAPDSPPNLVSRPLNVEERCRGLLGMSLMGGAVTSADMEASSPFERNSQVPVILDKPARPTHCLVHAVLNKRTGIDGKPYEMQVEVRLPVTWNGRFLYQGGGGVDGFLFPADGGQMLAADQDSALMRGYAVATTDSGHQREVGPANGDYLFAADPQARDEYGYQQIPLVHGAAVKIIATAYGQMPVRSYFYGASNGGRQAMVAAQRYPDLFDGIVSYASGFRLVQAALAGSIFHAQLAARLAPHRSDGTPDIDHPLTAQKLKVISDRILEACDARDGARDGMVSDSLSCSVDPQKWICKKDAPKGCLSKAEAAFVRDFLAGPKLRDGKPAYSSLAADPNVIFSIGGNWVSLFPIFWGEASHVYTTPPTISPDMMSYLLKSDLDTEYRKAFATTPVFKHSGVEFTNGDSPDMDAFQRHGGKLIAFTGAADEAFPSPDSAAYMDSVFTRYGKEGADNFVRLFIIPGFGHAFPYKQSTTQVDLIGAVVDWAENGRPPEGLMASARPDADWPGRTRPLCAYPTSAYYTGSGSIEKGNNFTCRAGSASNRLR
jgi:pimeloyl-ACP methyl ester carboxylesterase